MPDTRYRRGRAYAADMAVYARSMASDNSAQLDRVKRNLVRALREDVTARQREFLDRKSTRLNSSHYVSSRMPSSA